MEEDHGHTAVFQRFYGAGLFQIKMSVELRSQLHEGVSQLRRQLHLCDSLEDHFLCAGVAAVSKYADDIFGKGFAGGHDDRGSAHGDAGENDLPVRPALYHIVYPAEAIPALVDTEGDNTAVAGAAGTLIYHQCAAFDSKTTENTAAHIFFGGTPIAVEHQLNGSAGGVLEKLSPKGQAVEGSHGDVLVGHGAKLLCPADHSLVIRFVDIALRKLVFLRPQQFSWSRVKCHAVAYVGYQ